MSGVGREFPSPSPITQHPSPFLPRAGRTHIMIQTQGPLRESYSYCRDVARRRAKNFYYSFVVLPREKSDAMCAVYAFMRYCDDIADEPGAPRDKRAMLAKWRESLDLAARGEYGGSRILPAFHDAVSRFDIPLEYFHELIDGATMDLSPSKFETFEQTYDYCYHVASVVGLVSIHIFGFDDPEAKRYAEACGIAFQLTNILRDLKEDAAMGRVYLPEEDLRAHNYSAGDLANEVYDRRFIDLMKFEVDRARGYYDSARPLLAMVHPSGRKGLQAMIGIYSGLLDKIESSGYNVFGKPISLSIARKVWIAGRALVGADLL